MKQILSDKDLDTIFRSARSYNRWSDKAVSDITLQAIYDLMRWGPTSANSTPARFYFIKSAEAKEKLKPALDKGNVEKAMTAPCVAIIAQDMKFYDKLPQLFPHNLGVRDGYIGNEAKIKEHALRNSSLQGAYFIIAARALGLDCGPMSGFDNQKLDEIFFSGTDIKSNFICAIGEGAEEKLYPRGPRLGFDEACEVL